MEKIIREIKESMGSLVGELENFQEIARYINPLGGEVPKLSGIDVFGRSIPLNGIIGGDHIIYVDFKFRYDLDARILAARESGHKVIVQNLTALKGKAGIAIADVSGHQITDALLAAMLHQSFLLGAIYELDQFGTITEKLFENLNTRFYNSISISKFLTMIYGEISEDGTFKFISAGHPMPIIFSNLHDRIVDIHEERLSAFPPIGTLPSKTDIDRNSYESVLGFKDRYTTNQLDLIGLGDILVLFTDGVFEHHRGEEDYFPTHLENKLREVKDQTAEQIFLAIKEDILAFSPPDDDVSYVVVKRTNQ